MHREQPLGHVTVLGPRMTEHEDFIRVVAALRKDGEDDGDGNAWVMENDDAAYETLHEIISQAREMLGLPERNDPPAKLTTAVEVAAAVVAWINREHGTPETFERLQGMVLTNGEAALLHPDLYTVSNEALVVVVEGIYEWSYLAPNALKFPGWELHPLTGYALGIYRQETS